MGSGACAGSCNGSSAACSYPGPSMTCSQPTCSGGVATGAGACNGMGACAAGSTTPCGTFACAASACYTSCTSQTQCAANTICSGGVCSACSSSQSICGNSCVTLASDGANCGTCSHSCYGGACSSSQCQPVAVVTATNNNTLYALGSGRLYLYTSSAASGTTIQYVSTSAAPGTTPTSFSTIPNQSCGFLNADPATGDLMMQCYAITSGVVDQSTQYLRRVSATAGGAGTQMFQVAMGAFGAVQPYQTGTGQFVYSDAALPTNVRIASTTATSASNLVTFTNGSSISTDVLGADQTSAYVWLSVDNSSYLMQVLLSPIGNPTYYTLDTGYTAGGGVFSDGSNVFFATSQTGIYSVAKGMNVPPAAVTTVMTDSTLSQFGNVDASSIYYATQVDTVTGATGCSSYRIARRPKTGGAETPMYDGTQNCVTSMQGDANVIVYATRGLGCGSMTCNYGIYKIAK
jgi:hypothetical protein